MNESREVRLKEWKEYSEGGLTDGANVCRESLDGQGTEWGTSGEKDGLTGKSLPLQNNQGMISRWEGRGRGTERDSWRDGEDNAEKGKRRERCRTEAWRLASI